MHATPEKAKAINNVHREGGMSSKTSRQMEGIARFVSSKMSTRPEVFSMKVELVVVGLHDIVRQVNQELRKATLRSGIVAKDRGEGSIAEGLWKALSKGFAGTGVITEATLLLEYSFRVYFRVTYRRKQRTTCFSRRTVCCSTSWLTMLLRTVPTA